MRIYILKYKLYRPNGGSYKYAENPSYDPIIKFFQKGKRDKFIKAYQWASSKEDLEVGDIKCLLCDNPINITNEMENIINAI